jgi:uncharacterized protein YeeX (DUF496 family)
MNKDNIVDIKVKMTQKDLADMSEHLLLKAAEIMQKNRELEEKVQHLEELLMKADVINIGDKNGNN